MIDVDATLFEFAQKIAEARRVSALYWMLESMANDGKESLYRKRAEAYETSACQWDRLHEEALAYRDRMPIHPRIKPVRLPGPFPKCPGPNATRAEIHAFHAGCRSLWWAHIGFAGWDCEPEQDDPPRPPCRGWDGYSRRCDCGNRRVYWDHDGNAVAD
jgi:hypothetical protein